MDNLIFSLNATLPVFLMMVLGIVLKKIGWVSESFASQMNKFVFLVPLPLLLFQDLATVDFEKAWNFKFVAFCFIVDGFEYLHLLFVISSFLKERSLRGEFIQASYRSSAALLGVALIQNIYGHFSHGSIDDYWQCSTLQCYGSYSFINLSASS